MEDPENEGVRPATEKDKKSELQYKKEMMQAFPFLKRMRGQTQKNERATGRLSVDDKSEKLEFVRTSKTDRSGPQLSK